MFARAQVKSIVEEWAKRHLVFPSEFRPMTACSSDPQKLNTSSANATGAAVGASTPVAKKCGGGVDLLAAALVRAAYTADCGNLGCRAGAHLFAPLPPPRRSKFFEDALAAAAVAAAAARGTPQKQATGALSTVSTSTKAADPAAAKLAAASACSKPAPRSAATVQIKCQLGGEVYYRCSWNPSSPHAASQTAAPPPPPVKTKKRVTSETSMTHAKKQCGVERVAVAQSFGDPPLH
eukprot:SAG11_NODE_647_length_7957_cov_2.900903_4_plen_236_part_00